MGGADGRGVRLTGAVPSRQWKSARKAVAVSVTLDTDFYLRRNAGSNFFINLDSSINPDFETDGEGVGDFLVQFARGCAASDA